MLIPEPMVCEVAPGYLGRMSTINGFYSVAQTETALRQYAARRYGIAPTNAMAHVLATVLGMNTRDFCRQHTMLPFIRAVHPEDLAHGDPTAETVLRSTGMRMPRRGAYFCRQCANEDLGYWGVAYFRREHQLPGVIKCSKHQAPLASTSKLDHFHEPPQNETTLEEASSQSDSEFSVSGDVPLVDRYTAIAEAWLSAARPISLRKIVELMTPRLEHHGLRRGVNGKRPVLSDLALESCPRDWLLQLFPRMKEKKPTAFFSPLDSALLSTTIACRSQSYALALALLFDTAEEALNACFNEDKTPRPPQTKQHRPGAEFWAGKELGEAYINHHGNTRQVARQVGFNEAHVRRRLLERGLPALSLYTPSELDALAAFIEGSALAESCQRLGVSMDKLEDLLRRACTPLADAISRFPAEATTSAKTRRTGPLDRANADIPNHRELIAPLAHADPTEPQNVAQNSSSPPIKSSNCDILAGSLERSAATAGATGAR